jgi:lysozyme
MTKLLQQIKLHEGLRLKPYRCTSDKLSIGFGRNLEDKGITQEEAEYLLSNDILAVQAVIWKVIPAYDKLNDARKGVLVNMAFNLGVNGLLKFKKMIAAISDGYFELAASEMLDSNWANQVGNRALELAEQMKTGEWQ